MFDLTGYFDEAGTHWGSEVIVVGGIVNPERDWRRLEIKWRKVLKKEGVPYFHATDLEAYPPRGIYKGWSRPRADRFADRMAAIAADHAGRGFGIHLSRAVWLQAVPFMAEYLEKKPHKLPYFVLAKNCIDVVIDEAAPKLPKGESVAFVFEQNDYMNDMIEGYGLAKQQHPHSKQFGSLGFACKERFAGLQAADMYAWHYRKLKEAQLSNRADRIHRLAATVLKKTDILREVPLSMLQRIVSEATKLMLKTPDE